MENTVASTPQTPKINNKSLWVHIFIGAVVLAIIAAVIVVFTNSNKLQQSNNSQTNNSTSNNEANDQESNFPDGFLPIKHIGINLEEFDPSTNTAGDLVFSDAKMGEFDIPIFDYGFVIPASSVRPNPQPNPQPTFIVPLGTKVHSLVDGVVVNIPKLYSNDYSIHIASEEGGQIIYETEHVINVKVSVGDRVNAGDEIAEVSDYDSHNLNGFGLYEIGILKAGNPPSHICPFLYLDNSIKEDTYNILKSVYKGWNDFRGVETYDENLEIPGCIITDEVSE